MADKKPMGFKVDYYVTSKTGGKSRNNFSTGINQINGAHSETAVLAYLRKRHPDAREITIMELEWQ